MIHPSHMVAIKLYEESIEQNRKLEKDLKESRHQITLLTKRIKDIQKQLETLEKTIKKAEAIIAVT